MASSCHSFKGILCQSFDLGGIGNPVRAFAILRTEQVTFTEFQQRVDSHLCGVDAGDFRQFGDARSADDQRNEQDWQVNVLRSPPQRTGGLGSGADEVFQQDKALERRSASFRITETRLIE